MCQNLTVVIELWMDSHSFTLFSIFLFFSSKCVMVNFYFILLDYTAQDGNTRILHS